MTRDFGSVPMAYVRTRRVPGSETVMRMLERHLKVATRYGGGFVESIDGQSGNSSRRDWFYYVNGVQAPVGAASTVVHQGDQIWWDLHDWASTQNIPAVVGSFPEPFLNGTGGRRLPVTLECAPDVQPACNRVSRELIRLGIKFASQVTGAGAGGDESLVLEVGTWRDLSSELVVDLIDHGPADSGIYARFASRGSRLDLLDPHGTVARTLGAGAGLVAATAQGSSAPTWLVTGTTTSGVSAAARALSPATLRDHFALAVQGSATLPIPVNPAS